MASCTPPLDPRGLIADAYRMDLSPEECRSVFLDWALGYGHDDFAPALRALLARYEAVQPEHPMTAVLREGLERPRRRGRRR